MINKKFQASQFKNLEVYRERSPNPHSKIVGQILICMVGKYPENAVCRRDGSYEKAVGIWEEL